MATIEAYHPPGAEVQASAAMSAALPGRADSRFSRRAGVAAGSAFYRTGERLDSLKRRKATAADRRKASDANPPLADPLVLAAVCERLMHTDYLDVTQVNVSVQDGVVVVGGTVPQRFMKHAIDDLLDGCPSVRAVDNRLRISGTGNVQLL